MKMNILILTQWFEPEPHFKGIKFAKALQKKGHSVEVLTGFPNYPGGKVYPGYRIRLWQKDVMDGIAILRVALYPSHDRSIIGRVMNYVSFAVSSAILGVLLVKKADVAYVYHPPATLGLPALALKYLRGIPIVYDIQDLWPDTLAATGMVKYPWILRLLGWGCLCVYRFVDKITVLSPGFKACLVDRGVPEQKVTVIYNWSNPIPDEESDVPFESQMDGKFVVLFAGNLGTAQGLDTVLDAARLLGDMHPEVCFALAGSGVEEARLRQRVQVEGLHNVVFLGRRPPDKMGPLYARADALLVHLRDEPLFTITIPSKTQAYLAVGKPILMGVRGDAAEMLKRAGAGIVFPPQNPEEMVKAMETLLSMSENARSILGSSGRRFYVDNLSLEAGVKAFELILEQAAFKQHNHSRV
jgi:glycosyltransferase involved in cell wall biosynthesis